MTQLGLSASQRYRLWIVISNCLLLRTSQGPQISRCQLEGHWCLKNSSSWAMALDKPSSWSTQGTLLMLESSLGLLGAIVQNADLMYYVSFSSSGLLRRIRWKRKISHMTRLCRCIIHQRSSNSHGHWWGGGTGRFAKPTSRAVEQKTGAGLRSSQIPLL